MSRAAASPFNGSVGFGYSSSCGRNTSKTFTRSAPYKHRVQALADWLWSSASARFISPGMPHPARQMQIESPLSPIETMWFSFAAQCILEKNLGRHTIFSE